MRPPEVITTELTVNLGLRPPYVETLGVVSKVPLGSVNNVTTDPSTGKNFFTQTNYTLITELALNREAFNEAKKKELGEHITAIKARIDSYMKYYSELWQLAFKSGYFNNGYSFATNLILKKEFFQTPEQVKQLGKQCKLFLDRCEINFEDLTQQKQDEQQYHQLSTKFFNHVATLGFYDGVYWQFKQQGRDIKWHPETIEMLPISTVISIFFLKNFNHFTFRELINLNGDALLRKLSREDIIFIMKHCPRIGRSFEGISCVFTAIVTTPALCSKLFIEDFADLIEYYSKPEYGELGNDFALSLLSATQTLNLALQKPKLLTKILPLIPFHKLQKEKLDRHYEYGAEALKIGVSILDHIKQHITAAAWRPNMTAALWAPVASASLFEQKDSLLMLRDEEICAQMAVRDIVRLITSSSGCFLADKQERMAIYFQHPAPSDVFILIERPNFSVVKNTEVYRLNYVFIEKERQLYYIEATGSLNRLYFAQAENPFKMDQFIEQLIQLKQEQGATESVHLSKENIKRMIISNQGKYFTSAGVLRITQACGEDEWVTDTDIESDREFLLKTIWEEFSEFRNDGVIYPNYLLATEELMKKFQWHRESCHLTYRELHEQPATQTPAPQQDTREDPSLKPNQDEQATIIGLPESTTWSNTQNTVLGISLASSALGTVGFILLESAVFSSAAGPYMWSISLGLTIVGGLLLAELGLYAFYNRERLFSNTQNTKFKPEENPSHGAFPSN